MSKIKVGEYVRTKKGYIYKIEDGEEFYEDSVNVGIGIVPDVEGIWVDKEHFDYVDKREIAKHSPNIIDLIEEGDYVNGSKVIDIAQAPVKFIYTENQEQKLALIPIINKQIETVITKEQFAEMEYKV